MFARGRAWPIAEAAVLGLGMILRLRMLVTFDPHRGYDGDEHLAYASYLLEHHETPALDFSYVAYHPPLYYLLAAAVIATFGAARVQILSVLFGIATLAIFAFGLRRFLPRENFARVLALVVAAVLPAAVHRDGMVSNEGLLCTLSMAGLLALGEALRAEGRDRLRWSAVAGVVIGIAMLTKISALMLAVAALCGAVVELLPNAADPLLERLKRAAPIAAAAVVALVLSMPVHARFLGETGRLLPTAYDTGGVHGKLYDDMKAKPYLERRTLGYVFGIGNIPAMIARPIYPAGLKPVPRFWLPWIATAFGDYYNKAYYPVHAGERTDKINNHPFPRRWMLAQSITVAAGLVVTLTGAVAWLLALVSSLRRRRAACTALLVAPALAVLGQLHFAIQYPFDHDGVLKAAYALFAMGPAFAVYGVGVSRSCRRWSTLPIAAVNLAALTALVVVAVLARFA